MAGEKERGATATSSTKADGSSEPLAITEVLQLKKKIYSYTVASSGFYSCTCSQEESGVEPLTLSIH